MACPTKNPIPTERRDRIQAVFIMICLIRVKFIRFVQLWCAIYVQFHVDRSRDVR